jgi:Fe-Mn family superoxide dismutase
MTMKKRTRQTMTRREALKRIALASAGSGVITNGVAQGQAVGPAPSPSGPFKLPPLGYAFDALEPGIDARTMEFHHGKHHAAYVANLNKAVAEFPALAAKTVEELVRDLNAVPEPVRAVVRNNAGGHANHSFFWPSLRRNAGSGPSGELARAIDRQFGNLAGFREEFTRVATGVFGSGWAWLTLAENDLRLEPTPNQDSPLSAGRTPLLALDVWEHAYYLKYQNHRAEYIAAFFELIDWDVVAERYRRVRS